MLTLRIDGDVVNTKQRSCWKQSAAAGTAAAAVEKSARVRTIGRTDGRTDRRESESRRPWTVIHKSDCDIEAVHALKHDSFHVVHAFTDQHRQ